MIMPIYLDYHATTPIDPRVLEAMMPYLTKAYGNPASATHAFGWQAEAAVTGARKQVAQLIHAKDKEIIFTSGATESNNLALFGAIGKINGRAPHLMVSQVEHSCVLTIASELQRRGIDVTFLPVNKYGQVEIDTIKQNLKPTTQMISLIFANNEIGTLNPIKEIGRFAREKEILFHVDAAQAAGKIPIDVNDLNIDLMSLSGHKMYGPKGIGALFIRSQPRVKIDPVIFGGGQERGIRPGTLNVPAIVGLGKACEICQMEMPTESLRLKALRDKLENAIKSNLSGVQVNGHPVDRLYMNLNVSFKDTASDFVLQNLSGLAISSGSACASASMKSSHVLSAIGVPENLARSTLRISVGRPTTEAEVDAAIEIIINGINKCRRLSLGT